MIRKIEPKPNIQPVPLELARAVWRSFEAIWPPEQPAEPVHKPKEDNNGKPSVA